MRKINLIGIDLGTSGVRTTVYDQNGGVVDSGQVDLEKQSQEEWENSLKGATPEIPKGDNICSIDSTSGTVIAVDSKGEMVFPPQMYHESAPKQAARVKDFDSATEIEEKGVSISATSPLPKIMRLKEKNPNKFEKVSWILNPTTWLLYRLCNEEGAPWKNLETDWTNALKFGADITKEEPDWYAHGDQ